METLIIRHKKENLAKCSLRGLENREDLRFIRYPFASLPPLDRYLLLVMEDAPLLSMEDAEEGLLFLDSTWRYLPKMLAAVDAQGPVRKRVLPAGYRTAYPRRQEDCVDPARGLSTLEALYIAFRLTGRPTEGLLDHYHWKEKFLELNNFS